MARILIIDDNRTNLELMRYLLTAFGHECECATDGASGLERARAGAFDLALVDVLMPGMSGHDFARSFKGDARLGRIPLIAVTALAMPGDRDRAAQAGFDGYITKPIDPQRFVGSVMRYLPEHERGEATQAAAGDATTERTSPERGPIVLAVDDVQANLDVLRASLAPFGYRVAEARSVREALHFIERTTPALIVCDLHMPGQSGVALIEGIREHPEWRSIPFIFLSSTAWQTKDRRRGMELGARKFILRPIDPERLRREVEELIGPGDDSHR